IGLANIAFNFVSSTGKPERARHDACGQRADTCTTPFRRKGKALKSRAASTSLTLQTHRQAETR
ncbi:hypothetical protein, partial [Sphingobium bisphenolivorans]|uniref:hypothetical protein n=1 Tax=Sphingobium bisphenolivorans TaxID=1335760 RepID=UPI001EE6F424